MVNHMIGSNINFSVVDKRKATTPGATSDSFMGTTKTIFTANAGGTTTTLVGANAAPGTNDTNTIRRGEEFRLYDSTGKPKENTVFSVTNIAVGASTTVTFSPAAAVATVSTDTARLLSLDDFKDIDDLDTRLLTINGGTSYPQSRLDTMTVNDKIYALRAELDPTGL